VHGAGAPHHVPVQDRRLSNGDLTLLRTLRAPPLRAREPGIHPQDVILDVTGGTTPMRFGAALAAMTRGMRMVHQRVPQQFIDGEWILDPSKQREIVPMDNPLESTGLLREGQAIELFNRRDYAAAALVFEDVANKVSGVERGHYYRGLLLLSEGYGA
jgi:hypothetical protein